MRNKRGQFYLIAAVIVIAMILGFVAISNQSKKKEFTKFYDLGEELGIEAEAVLDYGIYNNENMKELLINFTKTYSNYTEIENLYFIFGDGAGITVAAYRKSTPAIILVDVGGGDQELIIFNGTYVNESYTPSGNGNVVNLTINEIKHEFELKQGQNFYFITSYGDYGEDYVFAGSVIKEIFEE